VSAALPVIVIGAGGHAAVLADALLACGRRVLGFTDADASRHGTTVCGLPVLGGDEALSVHDRAAIVLVNGLGDTGSAQSGAPRRRVQAALETQGWRFDGVRHPSAVVSPFAHVGRDAQLLAACVVQARALVGAACIVNTAAVVEHDVVLGDFGHVAPRAVVCGGACLGARCHVGAGAVLRQGVRVGDDMVIGAGAVVVNDFPESGVLVGVPARWRRA
jgi:sugar O-acyltransferase (sialic acid O-acetyltransferase NeuD family)